jgi:hypothetical protein
MSLVDESPYSFPSRASMERDVCLQKIFYLSSRIPSKGAIFQFPFTELP